MLPALQLCKNFRVRTLSFGTKLHTWLLMLLLLSTSIALALSPPPPPVPVLVPQTVLWVEPGEETRVRGEALVDVLEDGPLVVRLADSRVAMTAVSVDGVPAGLVPDGDSWLLVGQWPVGPHTIRWQLQVAADGDAEAGAVQFRVPRAAQTEVRVATAGDVWVDGAIAAKGVHFRPDGDSPLSIRWRPVGPPPVRPQTLQIDQESALSVDEAEVIAETRIDLHVRNGQLSSLPVRVPGGVETVEVLEPEGAMVSVSGESLTLTFSDPITDAARIRFRTRSRAPTDRESPAPVASVVGARGTHTIAVLRSDDAVVVPHLVGGGGSVAFADLPDSLRAVLPGAPVAAFSAPAGVGLTWRRLETTPAPEPPVLVDHALYEVAYAETGAGALRATFQVRNDRAPFLRVTLPPGWRPVSARVAGRVVTLSRDGDTLLVPLEKSAETMVGRVQLPVELSAVGPGQPWLARSWHAVAGPTLDAPVTRVEWQVTLPPERTARRTDGARAVVAATASVDLGVAQRRDGGERRGPQSVSDSSIVLEETAKKRTSTAYWSAAYDAYKENRFDDAERLLEQSVVLDPTNVAAMQLQSNIDLFNSADSGAASGGDDEAIARRVKAMARAKTGKDVEEQQRLTKVAEDAERSGDLDTAASAWRQLVETTETLAILEEDEAVDQKRALVDARARLEAAERQREPANEAMFLPPMVAIGTGEVDKDFGGEVEEGDLGGVEGAVFGGMVGSIEGGAAGGVMGGVVGGVLGGMLGAPAPPEDPEPIKRKALERIPTGRAYNAAVVVQQEGRRMPKADEPPPTPAPASPAPVVVDGNNAEVFFFEDIDVAGAFLQPQDAAIDDLPEEIVAKEEAKQEAVLVMSTVQSMPGVLRRSAGALRNSMDEWANDGLRVSDNTPARPPRPEALPGMTPLPDGITAARGDVALPLAPERLLHVEQQLLPAGSAAVFQVRLGRAPRSSAQKP